MSDEEPHVGITAVERETGLGKDLLRVWEKRYGFPAPLRDQHGDRAYPADQVEKLRLLRRLLDEGHRAGKIVPLPITDLHSMLRPITSDGGGEAPQHLSCSEELKAYIDLLLMHRSDELGAAMAAHIMRIGLERFIIEIAAPLSEMVGDYWARGTLQIFEEHLFTEQLTRVLRSTIQSLPNAPLATEGRQARPRILMTTLPGELHALGILMAESLMVLQGCECISLGTQTPVADIAQAATVQGADIVALSFSSWFNAGQISVALSQLNRLLPQQIEIWAGGRNAGLSRCSVDGVLVIRSLEDIREQLCVWKQKQH